VVPLLIVKKCNCLQEQILAESHGKNAGVASSCHEAEAKERESV
jgi:hypothetical protein